MLLLTTTTKKAEERKEMEWIKRKRKKYGSSVEYEPLLHIHIHTI